MTRVEYNDIMYAIDTVEERERELCRRYVDLNPQDEARRTNDRGLVIMGLNMVRSEIQKRFKNRLENT